MNLSTAEIKQSLATKSTKLYLRLTPEYKVKLETLAKQLGVFRASLATSLIIYALDNISHDEVQ